jgi:hypothetical protein
MTPEGAIAYYSNLLSKWWTEMQAVTGEAIESVRKKNYPAKDLALHVGRAWLNNLDAVAGLIPPSSDPLLPTVYIHETLSDYVNGRKPIIGSVYVRKRLPFPPPAPTCTELVRHGGATGTAGDVISVPPVDVKALTQGTILQVELLQPAPAGLKKGVYEGAVRVDESPVAAVLVELY